MPSIDDNYQKLEKIGEGGSLVRFYPQVLI